VRSPSRCLLAVLLLLSGCALAPPAVDPARTGELPRRVELDGTPFFPQEEHECGPAALATVLGASGLAVTPEQLVSEVYLPGRKGTLQPELVAAVRRQGRMPYELSPGLESLLAEVAAGRPALVLQKQGIGPWPAWHYAVLVGYDLDEGSVVLRSGRDRRALQSLRLFDASWQRAGRWALLVLRPGELPATADPARFMQSAAALEATGHRQEAREAYLAAAGEWPTSALPHVGLGNLAAAANAWDEAERRFAAAARLDPADASALNNHAESLLRLGCAAAAARQVERARRAAGSGPLAPAVAATAAEITDVTPVDAPGCPAVP
jgi:hypothetical protein